MASKPVQMPKKKSMPAGWNAWAALEPFTDKQKRANLAEYQRALAATNNGAVDTSPEPVASAPSNKSSKKRKRSAAPAHESGAPLSAAVEPAKSEVEQPSRLRMRTRSATKVSEDAPPAPKKRKTSSATPKTSKAPESAPAPPPAPKKRARAGKAKRGKAITAIAEAQPWTEQEYAWINLLKTDAAETRTWQDIANHMNAIQEHQRTAGAFQASYSRKMTTEKRKNGGVVPAVYTTAGPHHPVPAPDSS